MTIQTAFHKAGVSRAGHLREWSLSLVDGEGLIFFTPSSSNEVGNEVGLQDGG